MKKLITGPIFRLSVLMLILFIGMGLKSGLWAQETKKRNKARLGLMYKNVNDEKQLVASVKTKIDRSYEAVPGVEVKFYHDEIFGENLRGKAVSDKKGNAVFILPDAIDAFKDSSGQLVFHAVLEGHSEYNDTDRDLVIKDAVLEIQFEEIDSVKTITVFLGTPDSTGLAGIEDKNIKFYVQRLFGRLPIGEGFEKTDDQGRLTLEFPDDIKGDPEGQVTVIAELEDDEEFGTLVRSEKVFWGIPTASEKLEEKRELWSARSNVPLYLLIVVNILLAGIWGTILYIIYQLIGIRKIANGKI